MLCDRCNEEEATIFLKSDTFEGKTERKLCETCAKETGFITSFPKEETPPSISHFLSNWFGHLGITPEKPYENQVEISCPQCGLHFEQFLDGGKFGCATCYEAFQEQLPPILKKLHGGHLRYEGKVPAQFNARFAVERKIEETRKQLASAIADERFEEAALFRDEIRALEKQLIEGGK